MNNILNEISPFIEAGTRIDQILTQVYQVPPATIAASDSESRRHSENAANLSGYRKPYNDEQECLHLELMRRRAGWVTCLQAWGLLADFRAGKDIEPRNPELP